MKLNLENKVVLVAGGSKGIGLACAQGFHAESARVAIVSRSSANLHTAASTMPGCFTMAADLSDPAAARDAVEAVEENVGPIDVLVNSAGAAKTNAPEDLGPEAYRQGMNAKYFTYIHMIDATIKRMAQRKRGAILSLVGQGGKTAIPHHIAGGAANAAIMLASMGFAVAYADKGVRVNVVNPGATLTEGLRANLKREESEAQTGEGVLERYRRKVPMGRFATTEEIANVVVFLCSEKASYVTAAVLTMDGGTTATVV